MSNNIQNPSEFSASFVNTKEIAKELLGRLGNVDNYNPVYNFLRWIVDTSQDHTVFPPYFEQDHLDDVWSIWHQFQKNLETQTTTAKLETTELQNLKTIIADINTKVQRQDARITELEQNKLPVVDKIKDTDVTDISIRQAIVRVLSKYIRLKHALLRKEVSLFVDCSQDRYDRVINALHCSGEINLDTYNAYFIEPGMAKRLLSILNDIFKSTGPKIKMHELYTELEKRSNTKLDYVVAYVYAFCWKGLIANVNKEIGMVTGISVMEIADQEKINKLIAK